MTSKQAKNFNDCIRIMDEWGYDFIEKFSYKRKMCLVFHNRYNNGYPCNMQYFIGNKFKVTKDIRESNTIIIKRI